MDVSQVRAGGNRAAPNGEEGLGPHRRAGRVVCSRLLERIAGSRTVMMQRKKPDLKFEVRL
jgi:hypothetical protein